MHLIQRVAGFFSNLFWPSSRPQQYKAVTTPDKPRRLAPTAVYIVGDKRPWLLLMVCPCGCGATIQLNLLPEDRPCWQLTTHVDGTISAHPSIWRTEGCRSHFFLRRGSIKWHVDSPRG